MKIYLNPIRQDDSHEIMDIFNYYIENSFAAYPETRLPVEFFDMLLMLSNGYPALTARNDDKTMMGFGFLRPYNPLPTFLRTAEITYFVKPEFVGKGVGQALLDYLSEFAKKAGIINILANVSALNDKSIHFHLKNNFDECGRFRQIGEKKRANLRRNLFPEDAVLKK